MSIIRSSSLDTFGLLCSPDPYASCMRFFDVRGIHIEQLGVKSITQLIENQYILKPVDIFKLTAGKLTGLSRLGPRQAQNVINGITECRETSLKKLIFACGIYGIEEHMSFQLAQYFGNIETLLRVTLNDLECILPEALAVNVSNFLTHSENIKALEELFSEINVIYDI